MIIRDKVDPAILAQPCAKCGEKIEKDAACLLTFHNGAFVVLHPECGDFIDHATKGARKPSRKMPRKRTVETHEFTKGQK